VTLLGDFGKFLLYIANLYKTFKIHKNARKWLYMDFWKIDKVGKTGESMKNYFSSMIMNIFGKYYCTGI
jgi:hypothetical protein